MTAIHLIEKAGKAQGLRPIDYKMGIWESGYWKVTEATARKLVGGNIFLHTAWADPSHFGGQITGIRVHESTDPRENGRMVFRFDARLAMKGIVAPSGANGEKRVFLEAP